MKFRRSVLLASLCSFLLFPVAQAWSQSGRTTLPTRAQLDPLKLERAWWNQATLDPTRDAVRHLVGDEDVVFLQSNAGMVTAFDAENGRKLWASRLGRNYAPAFPAVTNDELVMIVIGSEVNALNKFTGKVVWQFNLPAAPASSPEADNDHVYIGTRDGSVYAFNLDKIRKYYSEGKLPQWSYQTMAWRYRAYKEVTTQPISDGKVVNFASRGGSLYSVTTSNRKLNYQFETDRPISAPLTKSGQSLFLPSEDFKLYCVNNVNGRTRWVYTAGLPIRQEAVVIDRDVYLTTVGGGMHNLDAGSGVRKWRHDQLKQFVAATDSALFATDTVGNVLLLNREDRRHIATLGWRDFSVRMMNDRTDRVYVAKPSGLIVCIREKGKEFPTYHKNPDRKPILPEFATDAPAKKTP